MRAPIGLGGRKSLFSAPARVGVSVTGARCPGRFGAARRLGPAAPDPPPPQPGRSTRHLPRGDGVPGLCMASISRGTRMSSSEILARYKASTSLPLASNLREAPWCGRGDEQRKPFVLNHLRSTGTLDLDRRHDLRSRIPLSHQPRPPSWLPALLKSSDSSKGVDYKPLSHARRDATWGLLAGLDGITGALGAAEPRPCLV